MEEKNLEKWAQKINKMVPEDCSQFIIYWHKFANSGLWTAKTLEQAIESASFLANQEQVYNVTIINTANSKQIVVKGGQ